MSTDFPNEGIWLDTNSPFNITSSNTVVLLNCSNNVFTTPRNCSLSSICHKYVKENDVAAKICGARSHTPQTCCHIKTGGSVTAYRIRVRKERCSAYFSFPNLDPSLPVSMWRPGVELEWELPEEPSCRVNEDCLDLENSVCSPNPMIGGSRKCMCKRGYEWDSVNGICQNSKCEHGRGCKRCNKKTSLIGDTKGKGHGKDSNGKVRKKKKMLLAVVASLGGIFSIVTVIGVIFYKKHNQAKQAKIKKRKEISSAKANALSSRIFTGREIRKATNNFSQENLVGTGGFGEVFKGTFDDGTVFAIKRAKLGCTKGIDQMQNEVRILCQVNHRSLVRLLGCCLELENPLLIYEYVSNGTLFDYLHRYSSGSREPLKWHQRLKIAHQTAEGLCYLHSAAVPPIYHRDVKSSNILLDDKLDAKVSDFGLSRLVELAEENKSHIFTSAQGTLGYLDPEYYRNFQLTDKSDVYSFGVVLMELLTAQKAIDFNREEESVNLAMYGKRKMVEDKLMDVVDPLLKEGASALELETMKSLGYLATACVDDQRQKRPSMKEVADDIEYMIKIVKGQVSKS
ncbi:Wall-associated receptor kinase-like 20 [Glycine soja]|nr:Wall-associated receptor kinase-like 20 [Glycine soja]